MKLVTPLLLLLSSASAFGMSNSIVDMGDKSSLEHLVLGVPAARVATRNVKSPIDLMYDQDGFLVKDETGIKRIPSYEVARPLRNMDMNQAARRLALSKVKVTQMNNGDYTVDEHGELKGGGPGGATLGFWLFKGTVMTVGHGGILVASALTGWGAPATFASLEGQFGIAIQAASNSAGLVGGIAGAFITGPA